MASKTSQDPQGQGPPHAESSIGAAQQDLSRLLVEQWLPQVAAGRMSYSEIAEQLLQLEFSPGAVYQPDVDRARRCGFGEVIFGEGKSPLVIRKVAERLLGNGQAEVLVTRVPSDVAANVSRFFASARYDLQGRTLRLANQPQTDGGGSEETHMGRREVVVVCAGSTDLPVAREALETLAWMQVRASGIFDVGVAGPYRLLPHLERLRRAVAVVVIAGMEGALASVVGGLVASPIIAVPTSIGYGANLQGITTLLSMLSSCAAGVTVVNVDGGFKGGYVAGLIARQHA